MVKVKYIGGFPSCRIKVGNATIDPWFKGEEKELSDEQAKKLEGNSDFEIVKNSEIKKSEKKVDFDYKLKSDIKIKEED